MLRGFLISHKIIIEILRFLHLYPLWDCVLVQYLTFGFPELHIGFVYLLVIALNGPPRYFVGVIVAFSVLYHWVLGLKELAAVFVAVLQDLKVRLSDRLGVNVLLGDLWLQSHWLDCCNSVLWTCAFSECRSVWKLRNCSEPFRLLWLDMETLHLRNFGSHHWLLDCICC